VIEAAEPHEGARNELFRPRRCAAGCAHLESGERMFESRVLGVDPGLARLGLAVVDGSGRKTALVWAGAVDTASDAEESERLRQLCAAVREAIAAHRPASVAVERVAWNKNHVSALSVARATGAIMVVAADAGLSVSEYGPNEVKIAVTGMGNADKQQVRRALVRVHGLQDVPMQADAADAVAVALTHLVGARMRGLARSGSR
jgi:crossover junction endodeoxyribonuclease RuvC